jgi:hypothetical protein
MPVARRDREKALADASRRGAYYVHTNVPSSSYTPGGTSLAVIATPPVGVHAVHVLRHAYVDDAVRGCGGARKNHHRKSE